VTNTRTRLHAVVAASAFAFAGVLGQPVAAMASAGPSSAPSPSVVTDQVAALTAASLNPAAPRAFSGPSGPATAPGASDGFGTPAPATSDASAAAAVVPPPAAPTDDQLFAVPMTAAQQTFTPTATQLSNAKAIVDAGQAMGLPPRAWVIAIATSIQESNLIDLGNLGYSNDHDSLGLFQQRPSSGWGTPDQILNPTYAASAFYQALVNVPGWNSLPLTVVAQTVQVSGYPSAYAPHEAQAAFMIDALYGVGPFAGLAAGMQY
jgi:hypothetical protein